MDVMNRMAANQIKEWVMKGKAIILTGARQVGKTTLLHEIFKNQSNILWLNADETSVRTRLKELNIESLKGVVGKYDMLVIDEIQRVENAGLLLKLLVDNFKHLKIVATGSSALDIAERIFEPLTGRHFLFHLYPFSLSELYGKKSPFEIEQQLPFHLIYGNYPDVCKNRLDAEKILKNLSNQYLYKDVLVWKDIRKPELLDKLLKLLAFQIGSEVSIHELANQLQVKSETVENYIDLLEKSFVIFRLKSYSTNARKEVTKMSKIYFWDNGIRNAVIGKFDDLSLRNDHGLLWKNFMTSERLKVNDWKENTIFSYFWRNYNQSEVDYVELERGKERAFEFKWNSKKQQKVSRAFTNLYPEAETFVITPRNFTEFCGID